MTAPNSAPVQKLNLVVGFATLGRREILARTIDFLALQVRLPDRVIVSPATDEDVDVASLERFPAPTTIVKGPTGLCAQRNRIIAAAAQSDIVIFFDDDFLADRYYLANLERMFLANPDVVATTGHVLADGIHGPGLSVEQGTAIIQNEKQSQHLGAVIADTYGTYGCNMAFRMQPIQRNGMLFDENLPLYGWQEDVDFSRRLLAHGRIVKNDELRGVHLGTKFGRNSGVRFGYSQIANPIYLIRKGTMSWKHAIWLIRRNLTANLVRSFYPEPWIDRRGRLKGNMLALADVVTRSISPLRILRMR
jgi:GT2 family glycosyltransferase